jgi:hypothetical protein
MYKHKVTVGRIGWRFMALLFNMDFDVSIESPVYDSSVLSIPAEIHGDPNWQNF